MATTDALSHFWETRVAVIRAFLERRANYAKLAEEIAYTLGRHVGAANVEYAEITHRAKALSSFCEKVARKGYEDPLREVTDVAGVRIVFLYLSDRPKIEIVIEEGFDVVEKADKVEKAATDRFGYGALHYLVRLGKEASGPRYDELKGLVCEIQVQSILQNAWAVVAHQLSYKQESDVPKALRRKLHALSGLFETADDQFDRLREEQAIYRDRVKEQMSVQDPEFLKQEINLDNLIEYLAWLLPDREAASREFMAGLLAELARHGYEHLAQIDDAITRSHDAVQAYEKQYPPVDEATGKQTVYNRAGIVRVALSLTNNEYMEAMYEEDRVAMMAAFVPLVGQ